MKTKQTRPRIFFFGTPDFAAAILESILTTDLAEVALVLTQPDRPSGRGHKLTPSPVKVIAQKFNLPLLQPEHIKKEQNTLLSEFKKFGPCDLAVVVAFGQILPTAILEYPRLGCLNIHASLLPRWRGASPIQHSLLFGDQETGICLMQMDEGLDTGPVYSRASLSITEDDNFGSLHQKLQDLAIQLLHKGLPKIIAGELQPEAQAEYGASYAIKLEGDYHAIVWSCAGQEIQDQIRACSPFPGAYTFFKGKRIKILKARFKAAPVLPFNDMPNPECGEILSVTTEGISVQLKDGVLTILELQPEGKKAMSVKDFLAGNSTWFSRGQILGRA